MCSKVYLGNFINGLYALIFRIITSIHIEHRNARHEDRDEDGTLLICLTYMVTIVLAIGLEEANRRDLGEILREILLDPVLDEAPVIKMGVDALFKILDKHAFADKMMEIFQAVFEPDQTIMDQTLEGEEGTPGSKRRSGFFRAGSRGLNTSVASRASSHQSEGVQMDVDREEGVVDEAGAAPEGGDTTPPPGIRGTRRALTEKELLALKNKV